MTVPLPTTIAPYNHTLDPAWRLVAEFRPTDMMQWAKQYTFGDNDSFNGTLQQYKPGNVYIDPATGDLILEGRNTGGGNVSTGTYTSGMIASWNAFSFKYGYLEGKLSVPGGKGLWPAFWTLLTTYPSSDELDIVEIFEDPTVLHRGLHYENPPGTKLSDGGQTTVFPTNQGYHYFGLEWTPQHISWFYDGQKIFTITNAVEFPHDVMYILLNLAIGGIVTSGAPDNTVTFPVKYRAEYIRLWQRPTSEYVFRPTFQNPGFGTYTAALKSYGPQYLYLFDETSGTTATDSSGNGHDGTYAATGVTLGQASLITGDTGKAVAFDGAAGYVHTLFDPTGLGKLSIVGSFTMPSVIGNDGRFIDNSHTDANNNGFQMVILGAGAGGLVSIGYGTGSINSYWSLANAALLQAGTTYHYGFSFDGQYLHVYINGALIGTANDTQQRTIASSGLTTDIGRGAYNNDYCAITADDVAIYPGTVLQAADFAALYARATTAPSHSSTASLSDAPISSTTLADVATF